ncbi:uncharacterized protein EI97DRAFT_255781 [Westerdykella ornata]|uniref:Uncharacterized protein n=1 Tax=Westerdykella ornata TaxID=318751 RepID=A0A6A6JPM0_WESOR|nr:uncharacterized protein EI97DRAFT_255781 [Westerdykella ornata]KAF2278472.1 hypothetical protein EI97DRAFT_255781 [Westerdykella ornata]
MRTSQQRHLGGSKVPRGSKLPQYSRSGKAHLLTPDPRFGPLDGCSPTALVLLPPARFIIQSLFPVYDNRGCNRRRTTTCERTDAGYTAPYSQPTTDIDGSTDRGRLNQHTVQTRTPPHNDKPCSWGAFPASSTDNTCIGNGQRICDLRQRGRP